MAVLVMTEQEEKVGKILTALGQHLEEILGGDPNDTFLYAEVDDEGYEVAIFHDEGDKVVYHDADEELFDEIIKLWETALDHEKWSVLEYDVSGDRFNSNFVYADQLDPEEDNIERRARLVRARYGDREIVYPSLGPNAVSLTLDDLAHLHDDEEK
jgi:nitrogen regulatory protein PII-like uncharacterized protein